jgi:hypothetical protein
MKARLQARTQKPFTEGNQGNEGPGKAPKPSPPCGLLSFLRSLLLKPVPAPLLAALVALAPSVAQAQGVEGAWVQRYAGLPGGNNDGGLKLVIDSAGNVIVAGGTAEGTTGADMLIIKYTSAGGDRHFRRRLYNDQVFEHRRALVD